MLENLFFVNENTGVVFNTFITNKSEYIFRQYTVIKYF